MFNAERSPDSPRSYQFSSVQFKMVSMCSEKPIRSILWEILAGQKIRGDERGDGGAGGLGGGGGVCDIDLVARAWVGVLPVKVDLLSLVFLFSPNATPSPQQCTRAHTCVCVCACVRACVRACARAPSQGFCLYIYFKKSLQES